MGQKVISVQGLGKRYRIANASRYQYKTLRETLTGALRRPFRGSGDGDRQQNFWALKDVSFEVEHSEVVGIIGRNGAGKSTLLKILSRITDPTEGRARVCGRVGSLLEVGTGFHPELTGRENIYLSGAILGMKKDEIGRRFDEIVAFSEVERFLDTPLKRYSSGMYLRLAFAVAAHLEPDILFVDEVLAVGDAAFQKKCVGKMSEVSRGGRTIIFVSHNMGVVSSLCSRVISLSGGKIEADGPPREVIHRALTQQESGEEQDIQRVRRPGFGDSIRVTWMRVVAPPGNVLLFQEPLVFQLRVASDKRYEGLRVAATISNVVGSPVATYFTDNTFDIDAGESLDLEVTVDNFNLAPDFYHTGFSIGFGGRTERWTNLDIVGGLSFEISMAAKTEMHLAWWDSSVVGNVLIPKATVKHLQPVTATNE